MYTPEEIEAMSADDRRKLVNVLARSRYASKRWKTDFARDTGIKPQTVVQWFTDRSEPPVWAIVLLKTWFEIRPLREKNETLKRTIYEASKILSPMVKPAPGSD